MKDIFFFLCVGLILFTPPLLAQDPSKGQDDDVWLSLDDLMGSTVVSAGKKAEQVKDVPASVVILTQSDIRRMGFQSLDEILQNIPGLYMIDDYYWLGSVNFGVRGFFSHGPFNNMVILVDGVSQMSDKYSDFPDVKINVPVQAIRRIEVIRGPMSVIYGSGAFFGAINIITRDNELETPVSTASVSYGSRNYINSFARYAQRSDDFYFAINAAYTKSIGIDRAFSDMTTKYSLMKETGLDTTATILGQKDDIRYHFSLALDYKDFFSDFSIIQTRKDVFDGRMNLPMGSEMNTRASNASFGYRFNISDAVSAQVKFGYYQHSHTIDYEVFHAHYYEIDEQNTSSYDLEFLLNFRLSGNLEGVGGIYRRTVLGIHQTSDFVYYGLNSGDGEVMLPRGDTYSTHAAFVQVDYTPITDFHFIGGLRLEHLEPYSIVYTRGVVSGDPGDLRLIDSAGVRNLYAATYYPKNDGFSLVSRLGLLYSINESSTIKLLWGQSTKQPSFSENHRQLPKGKPFLNAAKMNTFEVNYLLSFPAFLSMNLSAYYNRLEDLISTKNLFNQLTNEWEIYSISGGEMETSGIEFGLEIYPLKNLIMNISVTFQNSKDLRKGYENIEPGYAPNLLGYFDITYSFTEAITATLFGRYIGKTETYWATDTTPEKGYRIGAAIDPYLVLDANFRFNDIFIKGLFASLKVNNILDQDIRFPTTLTNDWAEKGTLGFNRGFYFTLGYNF